MNFSIVVQNVVAKQAISNIPQGAWGWQSPPLLLSGVGLGLALLSVHTHTHTHEWEGACEEESDVSHRGRAAFEGHGCVFWRFPFFFKTNRFACCNFCGENYC